MESNLHNRDFERFVQQNADQYRMFPSEKVWVNIHSALHTRRRWYGIALILLLLTTGVVTWVMLIPGNKTDRIAAISSKSSIATIAALTPKTAQPAEVDGPRYPETSELNNIAVANEPQETPFRTKEFPPATAISLDDIQNDRIDQSNDPVIASDPSPLSYPVALNNSASQNRSVVTSKPAVPKPPVVSAPAVMAQPDAIAAAKNPELKKEDDKKAAEKEDLKLPLIPERIEKDLANKSTARKKLSWQLYLTPTVSYRTLTENSAFINAVRYNNYVNATGGGTGFYPTDVNTVVNHKPDLGFQVGVRTAYPLSKWVSLTGGFQLSVSKYDIKAYQHPEEVATIALTDRSVSTVSSYRNTNGYKENWLRNFYFSASLPVGLELKLSDGTKNYFGIAGTLQPTYVLDNRSYMISADYKNYAEVPSLTRRWNMNTSFEVFSAHTTGKLKWRVGPQIRYQTMSSFEKNYPIKEHLFDFGLKLGIQLK